MFSVSPARTHRLLAAEGRFHLTFEQDEGLLEVMPMRRRSAAWRDVHIDYAEASSVSSPVTVMV